MTINRRGFFSLIAAAFGVRYVKVETVVVPTPTLGGMPIAGTYGAIERSTEVWWRNTSEFVPSPTLLDTLRALPNIARPDSAPPFDKIEIPEGY